MEPFSGKAERLTYEIYRVMTLEDRMLTAYDVWRLIIPMYRKRREPPPARTVVSRRVNVLAEKGFLKLSKTETMPSGTVKKYYTPTLKFHKAKRRRDLEKATRLVSMLTDFAEFSDEVPEETTKLVEKLKRFINENIEEI